MRWMFLAALLCAHQTANAGCPWEGGVESAYATMTTVTINGQTFNVKGSAARAQFMSVLNECKVNGAAVAVFNEWRSMRRWTNITGIVGACCLWPVLIATPITASMAGERKTELVMLLQSA